MDISGSGRMRRYFVFLAALLQLLYYKGALGSSRSMTFFF